MTPQIFVYCPDIFFWADKPALTHTHVTMTRGYIQRHQLKWWCHGDCACQQVFFKCSLLSTWTKKYKILGHTHRDTAFEIHQAKLLKFMERLAQSQPALDVSRPEFEPSKLEGPMAHLELAHSPWESYLPICSLHPLCRGTALKRMPGPQQPEETLYLSCVWSLDTCSKGITYNCAIGACARARRFAICG